MEMNLKIIENYQQFYNKLSFIKFVFMKVNITYSIKLLEKYNFIKNKNEDKKISCKNTFCN